MIWKCCLFEVVDATTVDALGNSTGETFKTVGDFLCRHSPFTNEELAIDGRNITKDTQRFILPCDASGLPNFTHFTMDGVRYRLTEVVRLEPRWTAIEGTVYKHEILG